MALSKISYYMLLFVYVWFLTTTTYGQVLVTKKYLANSVLF